MLNGVLPPEQVTDIISEVLGNKNKSVWERISVGLRKPVGQLPAQGASADGGADPFQGKAGLCRAGDEPAAGGSAARSDAQNAEPEAGGRGSDERHREDDARRLHDQLRAQSRLRHLSAHGRYHQQDGADADGGVAEEPLRIAAEVGGNSQGDAVHLRRHRQSHGEGAHAHLRSGPDRSRRDGAEGHRIRAFASLSWHRWRRVQGASWSTSLRPGFRRASAKSSKRGGRSPISRSKWPAEARSSSIRTRKSSPCLPSDQ